MTQRNPRGGAGIHFVHFSAEWAEACTQMNAELLPALAQEYPKLQYAVVDVEEVPDAATKYGVTSVPTVVVFKKGKEVERLEGANASQLNKRSKFYETVADFPELPERSKESKLKERIEVLLNRSQCMLFMKGEPGAPRCGFSRQIVEILQVYGTPFGHFDILQDEEVRQGLKDYSKWPTYPQLYVKGELVGGLDIVKELHESGDLKEQLPKAESLADRLSKLVNRSNVMVFMKGDREHPKCGFSRTLIDILNELKITYDTFDILEDEAVRQGLKKFSDWPTYPQLYKAGELIGGLDIVKELKESGELREALM